MENKIYVTHYINQEPSSRGWIELPFITRMENDNNSYYLGFEFNSPIPEEIIKKNETDNYYKPLLIAQEIELSQTVWVTPDEEVWIADSEDPFSGKRKSVAKSNYFLESLGLGKGQVKISEVPTEMKCSYDRLISGFKIKDFKKKVFKEKLINVINFNFISSQKKITKSLEDKIKDIFSKESNEFYIPDNDEKMYDIDERSMFYKGKSLFLYPFYLDIDRKKYAGVIPYAEQISMAIVIRKSNSFYKEWEILRNKVKREEEYTNNLFNWEIDLMITESETTDWLKRLINDLHNKGGSIHSITGYIFDTIMQEFIIKYMAANTKIGYLNKPSTDIANLEKLDFFSEYDNRKSLRLKTVEDSILVLDPAEAFGDTENKADIADKLDKKLFDIINVKHGLKIPVGIGYSLYMLPELLKNNIWKDLQNLMLSELNKEDIKKYYYTLGIKIKSIQPQLELV